MNAIRFRVTGRVQGVGFRFFTEQMATALRLKGHVRNEPDGSVSGHAQGQDEGIERLIAALQRGPPAAIVLEVRVDRAEPTDVSIFEISG